MNKIVFNNDEWFLELYNGQANAIKIKKHLFSRKTEFQQIDIFETEDCGRMLVLDGFVQATEFDEFAYQEMLTHIPMFSHPDPRNVLVIGGGDGGVLREIAKHECVENIDICEIDEGVINASREYLPSMACGFDDPRVNIRIADGSVFVKERPKYYDVIIVDSTDPFGPGEALFNEQFYRGMRDALKGNGIIATQAESMYLHLPIITRLVRTTKTLFPVCGYAFMLVPTYPNGTIGTCVGSMGPDVTKPCRKPSDAFAEKLRYYTPDVHEGAFKLPRFCAEALKNL